MLFAAVLIVPLLFLSVLGVPGRRTGAIGLKLRGSGGSGRHLPVPRMAGTVTQALPVKLPALTGAAAHVIRARVHDKEPVFLTDDSGSMYALKSGDATGIRYAAARSMVDLMRSAGGGTFHAIHWGSGVPDDLVFSAVSVKDRKVAKRALSIPPSLGGNNLPLALRKAHAVTQPKRDVERFVYLVISDGIETVTEETRAAIAALPPESVHMVLVDRGSGCSPQMEADWNTAGFASVTRLNTFDTRQMATQLAEIYANSIGLQLSEADPDSTTER